MITWVIAREAAMEWVGERLWNGWDARSVERLAREMRADSSARLGLVVMTQNQVYTLRNEIADGKELQVRYVNRGETANEAEEPGVIS